jgi:hypothetical protein
MFDLVSVEEAGGELIGISGGSFHSTRNFDFRNRSRTLGELKDPCRGNRVGRVLF